MSDFSITPQWDAAGVEPPPELIEQGFTAGYKPPADLFNYYFNQFCAAIAEAQSAINGAEETLDNKLNDESNAVHTAHIENGAVTAEKLAQSVLNTIDAKANKTDKVFKAAHMGVLMPALRGGFPDFSTSDKTLTLRQGTQLLLEGTESSEQVKELAPNGDTTIYCNSISSSAIKIYYNLQDEEFNVLEYNGVPTANDILICSIRDVSRYSSPDNGISISCAYTIDGKLFGVNLADYIANNSITEAQLSTAYKLSVQNSIDEINTYASGINSNVNSLKRLSLINLIKSATFEKGTLHNGVEAVSSTRIRSAFINISDVRYLQISVTTGFKYNIHFYKSDGTFIGNDAGTFYYAPQVNWNTEDKCIPVFLAVKYMRIVIAPTSNADTITLDDSNKVKVLSDYSQYRQFQFLNNFCGKLQESIVTHDNWANAATNGSGLDDSSTRICSGLIELPKSGIININTTTGYEACYVVYNENMTRIKATEYSTSCTAEIGNNYKWIVVFVKVDSGSNVDISPNAGSNCTISYIPTDNMQCIQNIATSAATNAVTNAENIQRVENIVSNAVTNAENIQRVENIVSNYEKVQHVDNIIPNPCTDIGWEYGILWENVEADSNTPFTRIRSNFILVGKGTRVKCNPSYNHLVFKYDRRKKWISNDTIYTSNEKVIDEECFIRIVMKKADDSAISESEISTIANTEIIIRQLPQSIVENASDFNDSIPSYYQPQLKAAIDSALNNIVAAGKNGESFIFISDPHEEANAGYSPRLIKEITKRVNIDKIICGGDMIEGGNKATIIKKFNDFVSAFRPAGKFFAAFGNHDTNTIGPNGRNPATEHLTKGEAYALMQKQIDYRVQYGDLCYYFFDNPTTKTRFIVLDTGLEGTGLDNAQRAWFENALNNMPNSYHALIFAHIIYVSSNWYVGVSPNAFTRTGFMDDICAICDAFNSAANGKTVEAIFGGHTHLDGEYSSTGGIPIIIIDCDARTTASADGQGNRDAVLGTITEQCFDIVTVDYAAKKIKCVRIGRGSDRTISYSEGE